MVAYSFKARFAPLIASGSKTQTIRSDRKRHARPGETLQLYTGMRTRSCRLIATATCLAVSPVRFDFRTGLDMVVVHEHPAIQPAARDFFAVSDGFSDWADLKAFWQAEHGGVETWEGVLIQWDGDTRVLP